MSYDVAIFGAAPDQGWCDTCEVSRHPGVLLMNGDEIQGCDECGVCDSDADAADRMRAAGCRVDLIPDDEPVDRGDPRAAWVLTGGGPFYCVAECHDVPWPLPCEECAATRG